MYRDVGLVGPEPGKLQAGGMGAVGAMGIMGDMGSMAIGAM